MVTAEVKIDFRRPALKGRLISIGYGIAEAMP
jgi:hypothetical protein